MNFYNIYWNPFIIFSDFFFSLYVFWRTSGYLIVIFFSSVTPHRGQPAAKCHPRWQPITRLAVSCGLGRRRIQTQDLRTTVSPIIHEGYTRATYTCFLSYLVSLSLALELLCCQIKVYNTYWTITKQQRHAAASSTVQPYLTSGGILTKKNTHQLLCLGLFMMLINSTLPPYRWSKNILDVLQWMNLSSS